jgi:hypothetical protein
MKKCTFGNKKYVWVMMESGLSPFLSERRIDIPFTVNQKVMIGSLALPKLVKRDQPELANNVKFDGTNIDSVIIGDMDKIMKTEFKARWPGVVTRAAIGAVTKLAIQAEMNKKNGYAGLITSLASAALTQADTRYWQLMPSTWSLARYEVSGEHQIVVPYGQQGMEISVTTSPNQSSLVYIKQPTISAKPLIKVLSI